ncbi:NADH-quinone oxidoreductase subunit L, partial [Pseudolycoriella hygida]
MILLGAEFLAMMFIVIYVGAIAVLFLFVIMMLDIHVVYASYFKRNLFISSLVAVIMCIDFIIIILLGTKNIPVVNSNIPADISNTKAIGEVLYTDFILPFQMAGIILFVAMISCIILTLRHSKVVRRQNIAKQNSKNKENSIQIIGMIGLFLHRKNIITILMSIELMLLAININFVVFSTYAREITGQIFSIIILTIAAAETAIGLAILLVYFRNKGSIELTSSDQMKGIIMITKTAILMVMLPLMSGIINGLGCAYFSKKQAAIISSSAMILSALLSILIFYNVGINNKILHIILANWLTVAGLKIYWAIYVDQLTAIMFIVVTWISAIVHIYSLGYMEDDDGLVKFLSFLSLFTFFMLALVSADNFLQLFFGWEGVGLCSYLLIGFWYKKESANKAAIKAFIVNRVGDFAFMLGIITIIVYFGVADYATIFSKVESLSNTRFINILGFNPLIIDTICLLLFLGCMGKSAQIGLHIWLPSAMEGPTPVSALIHAATMVTAGVFLLARCSHLFEYSEIVRQFITIIGGATCIFAASIAIMQQDIKKIIAYSTCSQLGYMFLACGVSAYNAGIFHLVTHAFFKALLFLSAGNLIHACHEQDIFKMGNLKDKMPLTYCNFLIGSLALIGIYPLAGFYSKDAILELAYSSGGVGLIVFIMGILAAILTSIYSMKIIMLVFHGKTKMNLTDYNMVKETPSIMNLPLTLLTVGSFCSGMIGHYIFFMDKPQGYFRDSIFNVHIYQKLANHPPLFIKLLPITVGIIGIICGFYLYNKFQQQNKIEQNNIGFVKKLLLNKYYFEEIYYSIFITPLERLSKILNIMDQEFIDRFGPNGFARVTSYFSNMINLFRNLLSLRDLRALAGRKTAAYLSVCEDLSAGSTYKLPAEVEFRKRSNISNQAIDVFVGTSKSPNKQVYAIYVAVLSSILTMLSTLYLLIQFDNSSSNYQFVEQYVWVKSIGLEFHVGVDGISILFVVLTAFLTLLCMLVSAFSSINLLLFYLFFEVILIPMYIIIGVWGGENRIYAALKFFLYTFFGSVFFLLSLIYIYSQLQSFNMVDLNTMMSLLTLPTQKILWVAIFIAFAIKVPMLPFHTWLPDAHVQAPTSGSVILAGILLKFGAYSFLRILLPMFPIISKEFAFYVLVLSIFAVIYSSLVAMAQKDMKKMIAYSSIAHMGYVTGGIFSLTEEGMKGAIYQMLSHGIVASALFLIVGTLYERLHTKEISKYGGVAAPMPILAVFFMISMLASIGLPGTSGFIGEFLSILGIYKFNIMMGVFISVGIILGAIYMLKLYKEVMLGKINNKDIEGLKDLTCYEILALAPLCIIIIIFGIKPNIIINMLCSSVNKILLQYITY